MSYVCGLVYLSTCMKVLCYSEPVIAYTAHYLSKRDHSVVYSKLSDENMCGHTKLRQQVVQFC